MGNGNQDYDDTLNFERHHLSSPRGGTVYWEDSHLGTLGFFLSSCKRASSSSVSFVMRGMSARSFLRSSEGYGASVVFGFDLWATALLLVALLELLFSAATGGCFFSDVLISSSVLIVVESGEAAADNEPALLPREFSLLETGLADELRELLEESDLSAFGSGFCCETMSMAFAAAFAETENGFLDEPQTTSQGRPLWMIILFQ